ncbi:hypothetical protein [Methylobacterium marchantiae]|uniref:HTH cro/C1-type domain-containing protein n=1 Tax=Methylobacterium marchantiae TaxID=600331 RepID=A0ABW3WYW8_9HYPH|nr:hypothetical protein AIGOOFII_3147 [Methylobacterium marchantiae]
MGTNIPGLGQKLKLLKRDSPYRTTKALAFKLGVSVSTLNGYANESSKSTAGFMPEKRLSILISLFEQALPVTLPTEEVRALVLGDAAALEAALRVGEKILLEDILKREARRDTGTIWRDQKLKLVRHEGTGADGLPTLKLNEPFRLEFDVGKKGFLLALQNVAQTWAVVRFADGEISPRAKSGMLHLPGKKRDKPVYMYEEDSTGIHRFGLFVSPLPFPLSVVQAAQGEKSLDWNLLCELARHFDAQHRHLRELHMIEINFIR